MTITINTPQDFVTRWLNLAQPRLGAKPLSCSDEWFAPAERMRAPTRQCSSSASSTITANGWTAGKRGAARKRAATITAS